VLLEGPELGVEADRGLVAAVAGLDEGGHLGLPAAAHLGGVHDGLRGGEVIGQHGAVEQAVLAQEELAVVPAGVAQGA
jgi:hypothetical protein